MSDKKKTDILKITAGAAFGAASVLFVWLLRQPRFSGIPPVLILSCAAAFALELLVLCFLRSKKVIVKVIKLIIVYVINASVITAGTIYCFGPAVILQPHTDEKAYADVKNIPGVNEIVFEGKNGSISGLFYDNAGADAPTLLYFYGNYETAATAMLGVMKNNPGLVNGVNFAVFDYPSYGRSEGKCTDVSLLDFSLDAYDKLAEFSDKIIVFGYSVGTGPAVYLASEREVKGLLLFAPYADGYDLYNNVIDIFHGPMKHLAAFNIESSKYAESVSVSPMIIASSDDKVIPYCSSSELAEEFGMCDFVTVNSTGHNDFFRSSEIMAAARKYIEEAAA